MTASLISEFYDWLDEEEEEEEEEEWLPEEKEAAAAVVELQMVSPPPSCSPTAAAYSSVCTTSTAEKYAHFYKVPPEYGLCAPRAEERVHAPPPGYAAVYTHHFLFGLRLPLQPFLISVLAHYEIALAQLHPNSIAAIAGFMELCKKVSVTPTVALFRHFFSIRTNRMTEGWYIFCSRAKIGHRQNLADGWKSSFMFFKTAPVTESVTMSWNYSAITDFPLAEEERPSEHTVNLISGNVKVSLKRKSAVLRQNPLEQEEEGRKIEANVRTASVSMSCCSENATVKTADENEQAKKPSTKPPKLKTMAELYATEPAKVLRGSTGKQLDNVVDSLSSLQCVKEQDFKDKATLLEGYHRLEKENASLRAEVSRLHSVSDDSGPILRVLETVIADKNEEIGLLKSLVDDRGPLLRVYTQKLLETRAFDRLFYDLTTSAQRLGRHEAAEQIQDRFPAAIPEEALEGLEDPLAAVKLENMFCDMVQDEAFKFPLLDHLLSLAEIPSSSQLRHLEVDDQDLMIDA